MPDLFAHRGFAAEHPENTVTAIRRAAERGADFIEIDVRRSASDDIVVHHDATVDRVTNGSGPVADHTSEELAALDVLDSGDGVPTLADVVEVLPSAVGLNVELKEEDIAEDTAKILDDVDGPVVVSSFSTTALADLQTVAPAIDRALLVERRPRQALDKAVSLECEYIHPRARLCLRSFIVRRAHQAGLQVNAWTLTSRRLTRWLTRLGVDGIIADTPDVLE